MLNSDDIIVYIIRRNKFVLYCKFSNVMIFKEIFLSDNFT